MISHTDIPLSSDIFLDSLVISIHILQLVFVSAIVMLAFKIKFIRTLSYLSGLSH